MKKLYLITLLFPLVLFAQSYLISNIPLPKTYVLNLDPYPCDEECLQKYLNNDLIFSFLAHAGSKLKNPQQEEIREKYTTLFNITPKITGKKLRIALLLPYKKIGRYAASTANASFAYLLAKNQPFELKSYKIESESYEDILSALQKIKKDEFYYVIAPLTEEGADIVTNINPQLNIYFPTINKKDVNTTSSSLYYGGIDYRAQTDLLLKEAAAPLVIFYDNSPLGKKLADYEEGKFKNIILKETSNTLSNEDTKDIKKLSRFSNKNRPVIKILIPKQTTNLERELKENKKINKASFFVNTPIIKSGMIMSQLTLYDTNATNILSNQGNYDPLLLSMTQYQDRKNMIIANSITQNKDVLIETNAILGNDIVYDWINYTTTIGIDYFFHHLNGEKREYDIELENNQMIYPIVLLKPSVYRFIPYKSAVEE